LRFQVDPMDPTPARDPRWVSLVLGLSLATVGGFLLVVDAIVTGALAGAGATCGSAPGGGGCSGTVLEYVLLAPGLVLLAVGAILAAFALARALA
jgi:hypothetical protein